MVKYWNIFASYLFNISGQTIHYDHFYMRTQGILFLCTYCLYSTAFVHFILIHFLISRIFLGSRKYVSGSFSLATYNISLMVRYGRLESRILLNSTISVPPDPAMLTYWKSLLWLTWMMTKMTSSWITLRIAMVSILWICRMVNIMNFAEWLILCILQNG